MDEKQLTKFESALKGIAAKLTKNLEDQKDIVQVGLEAIWSSARESLAYNDAWLLQHAKHRMFNYLALGSSLDNGFRETTQIDVNLENFNTGEIIDLSHPEDTVQGIYERDLKDLINKHISGRTSTTFQMLCSGYNETEIARKLKASQKNISRQRETIQNIVKKFYNSGRIALRKIRDKSCKKGQLWFCFT